MHLLLSLAYVYYFIIPGVYSLGTAGEASDVRSILRIDCGTSLYRSIQIFFSRRASVGLSRCKMHTNWPPYTQGRSVITHTFDGSRMILPQATRHIFGWNFASVKRKSYMSLVQLRRYRQRNDAPWVKGLLKPSGGNSSIN